MTIYRSNIEDIKYELEHKEEIKEKHNFDDDLYYVYMTGRMTPVMDWLLDKNCEIAD